MTTWTARRTSGRILSVTASSVLALLALACSTDPMLGGTTAALAGLGFFTSSPLGTRPSRWGTRTKPPRLTYLAALKQFGQRAFSHVDAAGLKEAAVEVVSRAVSADQIGLWEPREDTRLWHLSLGRGWADGYVGNAAVLVHLQDGHQDKEVDLSDPAPETSALPPVLAAHGVESACQVVVPGDEPLGILGIYGARSGGFDDDERDFLKNLAAMLAASLEWRYAECRQIVQMAVTRVLAESKTLLDAAPKLLQTLCESLGWECAALWLLDPAEKVLRCQDTWHVPSFDGAEFLSRTRQMTFLPGVGLPGRVWVTGESAWLQDVQKDENFPRGTLAEQTDLHGAFCFPIRLKHDLLGVMEFFMRNRFHPDRRVLRMMEEIAAKVGHFIEAKRIEEKLQATVIESKMAAMVQIAASVAHELRNPLGVIRNSAYYIRTKVTEDAKLVKHLEIIEREVTASDRVVDQLANFGRPISLALSHQDLREVIADALSVVRIPGSVKMSVTSDDLPKVKIDRDHFRRVLINLFTNAIQAMESGGELRVIIETQVDTLRLHIADSGKGIPGDKLSRIFEPFFTTKPKGIGLGLAICKQIVELHRGQLEVRSQPYQGTTFTITLPLE